MRNTDLVEKNFITKLSIKNTIWCAPHDKLPDKIWIERLHKIRFYFYTFILFSIHVYRFRIKFFIYIFLWYKMHCLVRYTYMYIYIYMHNSSEKNEYRRRKLMQDSVGQWRSTGTGDGLARNRRHVITWNDVVQQVCRHMAPSCHSVLLLIFSLFRV